MPPLCSRRSSAAACLRGDRGGTSWRHRNGRAGTAGQLVSFQTWGDNNDFIVLLATLDAKTTSAVQNVPLDDSKLPSHDKGGLDK